MELTMEKKKFLYSQMNRMRDFEEICSRNFFDGKLQGFIHVGIGEEASVAGVVAALEDKDYIAATHRGHGVVLLKGAPPQRMFAELCGRKTGLCKGRGGSMHMGYSEKHIIGTNGILGAGSPLMLGPALALKIMKSDAISVNFFGDGQSAEGGHHEAMVMAAAFDLPMLFVCTNNMYGMWTALTDVSKVTDLSVRAAGYGMPGVMVDGNDVLAVYEAATEAVARARRGEGPTFLELKTYRWHDHSEGMREDFRAKEEVEAWKEKCPIKRFRAYLLSEGVDAAELDKIEADALQEMNDAFAWALEQEFPPVEWAYQDVYSNLTVEVEK